MFQYQGAERVTWPQIGGGQFIDSGIVYTETKKFSQYFDISISIPKHIVAWTIYEYIVCISILFNKPVSTDIYTLTSIRLIQFYKMHVQHMLRETDDLSNQVKL